MGTDNFMLHIITRDFCKDIANDVERWFDTSNYDENNKRALPIVNIKKASGFFKGELGGKTIKELCALKAKMYAYLMDDDSEKKKAKGTKKSVIKRRLMHENYKDCLCNNALMLRSQQRFKRDHNEVYTQKVNKIALSSDDDKRLQIFDKVTTFPHGTNVFKLCENKMLNVRERH